MDGTRAVAFAAVGECMMEVAPAGNGFHRLGFAGDTFNTTWTVRALLPAHAAIRYVSAVGTDWASDAMAAFMGEAGIDVSLLARDPARTVGLYAIQLDAAGERSFSYWRKDSAATRLGDDPARLGAALRDSSMVFFSGITLAILPEAGRRNLIEALGAARRNGARIAFDPNYRARLWSDADEARSSFAHALGFCDVVLPTFADEAELWGDTDANKTADRLLALGVLEVAVKNGAEPALVAADSMRRFVPLPRSVVLVDSTGAGDAFNGAYLAARLEGLSPEAAAARGHSVAAVAIGTRGALVPPECRGVV